MQIDNKVRSMIKPQITIEGLEQGREYKIGTSFVLNDLGVYYVTMNKDTGEKKTDRIAGAIYIKETLRNLDEEIVYVKLVYKQHGKYYESNVTKEQIAIPNNLVKLNAMGAEIPYEHRNLIVTYIREQEKSTAYYKEIYSKAGFHLNDKHEWNFFHAEVIPKRAVITVYDEGNGALQLTPMGSLKVWINMVKEEVEGHTPLEFILAAGFSAPLVGYLSQSMTIDTIFIHLNGSSTGGKTSSSMLAVSPFGDPNPKSDKSLMQNWSSTANSIIENFNGNMGIPIVLDELSMNKSKELSAMFYAIVAGKGKGRLTDQIKQRKKARWATTVLSNGEISAFLRSNENTGLKVRVKEFNGVEWTKSAQNADNIRQVITDNYGYAGIAFVNHIFTIGLPKVEELWLTWMKRIDEALPQSEYTTRVAKDYAVIMTAVTLVNEALELSFNEDNIMQFIVMHEVEATESRNTGRHAYEKIKQIIIENQNNFRQEGVYNYPKKCWGKIFYHNEHIEFAVLTDVMEQQLKNIGFENMKTILKDWNKDGLLNTENDRNSRRIRIWNMDELEQEQRKLMLGKTPPAKYEDTTYNLMIPKVELEGLLTKIRSVEDFKNDQDIGIDFLE